MKRFGPILSEIGILPVVCLRNERELDTFLEAILPSPVRCVEITLRHPFSPAAIAYIKKKHPEITVGAGTVSTPERLDEAIRHGADFCVAPGTLPSLLSLAEKKGIPFLPGATTPSEIMLLSSLGHEVMKLFPAECAGGVKLLDLYAGAFAEISFLPTGGITKDNLSDYAARKNVLALGGSFMVPKVMLEAGDAEGIYQTVCACIQTYREAKAK